MKLTLGLVIYNESETLITRCLKLAEQAYKDALEHIIIISKTLRTFEFLDLKTNLIIEYYPDNLKPQFLNMQQIYNIYLAKTTSTHLITLDADTIVVRWDQQFYNLAGQRISYNYTKIQAYFYNMPSQWQTLNAMHKRLQYIGGIRSIQGGWSMRSRDVAQKMQTLFCPDSDFPWESKHRCGHELVFGLYLKYAKLEELLDAPSVDTNTTPTPRYRCLYAPERPIKKKLRAHTLVVHPIKDDEAFLHLTKVFPSIAL